jgi:hypothetical protein
MEAGGGLSPLDIDSNSLRCVWDLNEKKVNQDQVRTFTLPMGKFRAEGN